jgi:hypothetical protein
MEGLGYGVIEEDCAWAAWLKLDTPAGIVQLLRWENGISGRFRVVPPPAPSL